MRSADIQKWWNGETLTVPVGRVLFCNAPVPCRRPVAGCWAGFHKHAEAAFFICSNARCQLLRSPWQMNLPGGKKPPPPVNEQEGIELVFQCLLQSLQTRAICTLETVCEAMWWGSYFLCWIYKHGVFFQMALSSLAKHYFAPSFSVIWWLLTIVSY